MKNIAIHETHLTEEMNCNKKNGYKTSVLRQGGGVVCQSCCYRRNALCLLLCFLRTGGPRLRMKHSAVEYVLPLL
jgi:hypothetical protein